jgi:hypothetical protein
MSFSVVRGVYEMRIQPCVDRADEVLRGGFISTEKPDEGIGREAYGFGDRAPGTRPDEPGSRASRRSGNRDCQGRGGTRRHGTRRGFETAPIDRSSSSPQPRT